ncbi:hypothetical protein OLMES_1067 [Oleiphilus messinensis]|uniref:Uncharacterized protein n=2 Tax=Oleiphilus messinensis TaxID=141451 RepID=A0A1Y0I6Y2_9GAMM|nr:hypothetical protein OLMES_1067 [Oleiphilus messinensis]
MLAFRKVLSLRRWVGFELMTSSLFIAVCSLLVVGYIVFAIIQPVKKLQPIKVKSDEQQARELARRVRR